jgi:putative DNA primase/helicase
MFACNSNDLPNIIAESGLAARVAQLPDPSPLGIRALSRSLQLAYVDYLLAQAIDGRSKSLIVHAMNVAMKKNDKDDKSILASSLNDLLSMDIPPREYIIYPIIPVQGLALLFAERGIGKTFVALSLAIAVASGSNFLRWKAGKAWKVLYLDGEMPVSSMQERLAALLAGKDIQIPYPDYFQIITPDLQNRSMPDLSTAVGQKIIEPMVAGADLIILDNLSTLCRTGKENEGESWLAVQQWLLNLRQRQKSVLVIHHAGKNGQQRGTSRREDVLDTVITLRRPKDYQAKQGARFEIHYSKARGIIGDEASPFEAQVITTGAGALSWATRDIIDVEMDMVQRLLDQGYSVRDIAAETGLSKSKVGRISLKIIDNLKKTTECQPNQ